MGAAIAQRLLGLGHEVTVWNRTAEKTRPLAAAGAKVAATPAQLAAACETVITILTDAAGDRRRLRTGETVCCREARAASCSSR